MSQTPNIDSYHLSDTPQIHKITLLCVRIDTQYSYSSINKPIKIPLKKKAVEFLAVKECFTAIAVANIADKNI